MADEKKVDLVPVVFTQGEYSDYEITGFAMVPAELVKAHKDLYYERIAGLGKIRANAGIYSYGPWPVASKAHRAETVRLLKESAKALKAAAVGSTDWREIREE